MVGAEGMAVTWSRLVLTVPQGANVEVGLFLFGVIMLSLNVGLIVAMRYERRVR
jgi:hypothetical protein